MGPVVAIGMILLGMILEGGHVQSLIQLTAFMIVGGGTAGAILASFPLDHTVQALKALKICIIPPKSDHEKVIAELTELCQFARKNGIMALEGKAKAHPDAFTRKGLSLVVDGIDPAMLLSIMETELETFEEHAKIPIPVMEGGGAYAPTVGIIGAVLGLIHVMSNLDDPSKLGGGIATAFVATIYGLTIANVIALPLASKYKIRVAQMVHEKNMILQGLVALQNGENPHFLSQRLRAFLPGGGHGAKEGAAH
ncbi:MAG: motA [Fibrobacteres bacterium]|nr:motA [Fibrobacterota bacterium]